MKSPFQQAKDIKQANAKSPVIKTTCKAATETADKPTTVFDTTHTGYNSVDTLTNCPVCGVTMTPATIETLDGRQVPVNYCLRHRTCLPTGLTDTGSKQ